MANLGRGYAKLYLEDTLFYDFFKCDNVKITF